MPRGGRTAGPTALLPVRRPARGLAATFVATVLTAGPAVLLGAAPAQATGDHGTTRGTSGAVVLRTGLDVGLLHKTVKVPLRVALNEVHAPGSADKTALSVNLDGIDRGRPFSVLRADVATARATADRHKAEGYANVAHAKVHVPGLPLLSLIEVRQVTAKAVCEAGRKPRAESNVLGEVRVLGKKVTLTAGGTTEVKVPGVGTVRLDLSKRSVTSRSAAATALDLNVDINPLKLNVAEVNGRVTLAEATCTAPRGKAPEPPEAGGTTGATSGGKATEVTDRSDAGPAPQNLAETGGSSTTPYLAGGAALLLAAGAGSLAYARRRRAGRG
ncbi:SCO1860 family LAETG-anchored protein [Streptomyces sp. NPDC091266]|uniref:SCO1860 family LAETG-anchored protein n=1 Tax=Streptomyces sp. NPDC091266 TaxID=3365978 RepID=UPI00382E5A95